MVRAEESDFETKLTDSDTRTLILSQFVQHEVVSDWKDYDLFLDSIHEDYVSVATFDKLLFYINSLETKLSGAILKVRVWNLDKDKNKQILQEYSEDIKFDFNELPDNSSDVSTFFRVCIKKSASDKILNGIKKIPNHVETELLLHLSTEKDIRISQIRLLDGKYLHTYWPQDVVTETSINDILTKTSLPACPEMNKKIFVFTIECLQEHIINENNSAILNLGDRINLHIDDFPVLFFYCTSKIPYLQFFKEFTIKLKPYDERYSEKIKEVENFNCIPSMLIEVCKTNSSSWDYINLQFTEYKYDETNDTYSWLDKNNTISYNNINFNNEPAITFKSNGIDLYTTIVTLKTTPVIKIYFDKKGLSYEDKIYERLKESIYEITLSSYGKLKESITIDKNLFEIKNDDVSFSLNFKIPIINEIFAIKSTLEERDGVFNISVKSKKETIIETTICLYYEFMVLVSSNRLIEYLKKFGFENDVVKSSSSDNSSHKKDKSKTNLNKK